MQNKTQDLLDGINDIVIEHVVFANGGYDDSVHHLIGPEFSDALSFIIITIVYPILTGTVATFLADLIKQRGGPSIKLGITSGPMHVKGEKQFDGDSIVTMEEVVKHMDETPNIDAPIIMDKVKDAQDSLYLLLMANGWPSSVAKSDAQEMMNLIIRKHHGEK